MGATQAAAAATAGRGTAADALLTPGVSPLPSSCPPLFVSGPDRFLRFHRRRLLLRVVFLAAALKGD